QRREPVIDRPRLRALMDGPPATVMLLIAPAGYGKTTLAHQWLAESGHIAYWHTCRPASADIAALALSLARRAPDLFRGATRRLESRLRNPSVFGENPNALAQLLIETLAQDQGSWLVLDDYHEIMGSSEAERLVADLVDSQKVLILIASRRRPTWA